jgi:hypothetical protein
VIAGLALAIALVALALIAATLAGIWSLRRSVGGIHDEIERLHQGAATADDLRAAMADVLADATALDPTDELGPISRVPQRLRTGPVIKAMALGSGTAHVARRLRGTSDTGGGAANGQRRNGH